MLNATVRARMDEELKNKAENILNELGLNTTQAINLFYRKIVAEQGIPFDLKIPKKNLLKSIDEAKKNDGKYHSSIDDMMKDLKE